MRNADLTIVMADGRIAERGTHAALLTQQGIYAQLVRRQTDGGAPPLAEDTEDDEEVSCHVMAPQSKRLSLRWVLCRLVGLHHKLPGTPWQQQAGRLLHL